MNPDGNSPLPKSIGEDPTQKISNVGGGPSELLKEAKMPYQPYQPYQPVQQPTQPRQTYQPYSPASPTIDPNINNINSPISSPNYRVPNAPTQTAVPTSTQAPSPAPAPIPAPTPIPQTNQAQQNPQDIRGRIIRTLEGDVADAIEKKRASALTVALAESERSAKVSSISNREPSGAGIGLLKILFSLIFIAAGLGGLYYLFLMSPLAPQKTNPIVSSLSPSIIKPDSQTLLAVDGVSEENLIRQVRGTRNTASAGGSGSVSEIIFTKKESDFVYRAGVSETADKLRILMPDLLARSLYDEWMFGWYTSERADPFIILKNNFFQNAFAGMLKWEETIADDLAQVFSISTPDFIPITITPVTTGTTTATSTSNTASTTNAINSNTASTTNNVATSTSTATSTVSLPIVIAPPPSSFFSIKGSFEDKVIKNKDVRIFKSVSGNTLLLYSFVNKDTIVITTSEAALNGIIERIERTALMR